MKAVSSTEERLLDLLIKRTLEGVDLDEAREITLLLADHPDVDPEDIEGAVAALDAIALGDQPPVPGTLYTSVMARVAPGQASELQREDQGRRSAAWPWLAAASIALAAVGWWLVFDTSTTPQWVKVKRQQPVLPPQTVNVPDDRERVYRDPQKLVVPFVPTDEASGIQGVVYWSGASQLGYMEFDGLAANDPAVEQYQLWIFDATRSDAQPVDGGVFNIAGRGASVVEIRAKLPVREATLFAITVEPPGGSVVSTRERLLALATPANP